MSYKIIPFKFIYMIDFMLRSDYCGALKEEPIPCLIIFYSNSNHINLFFY